MRSRALASTWSVAASERRTRMWWAIQVAMEVNPSAWATSSAQAMSSILRAAISASASASARSAMRFSSVGMKVALSPRLDFIWSRIARAVSVMRCIAASNRCRP